MLPCIILKEGSPEEGQTEVWVINHHRSAFFTLFVAAFT
jgi:hypothetical protein